VTTVFEHSYHDTLAIVGARALESNLVRVLLNREPFHVSALGLGDALNRDSWALAVVDGAATTPVIEQVERVAEDPSEGWFVELRTAMRVVTPGTVFAAVANPALLASDATPIAAPPGDRWEFPGLVLARPRVPAQRSVARRGVDLRFDLLGGRWILDATGDVDIEFGLRALRKRIVRRALGAPGGFYHLPRFGAGARAGKLARKTVAARLRTALLEQVLGEEGVLRADVTVSRPEPGIWVFALRVETAQGTLDLALERPDDPS
jgi:hypothetical protein